MSDDVTTAFRDQPTFRETPDGGFSLDGLDFDGEATIDGDAVHLTLELPTIDAAVVGERVAPVVAEGWFETFQRRLEDVSTAIDGPVGEPTVEIDGGTVHVQIEIDGESLDPSRLAETTRHAANYVEGTWVEGIIPGYEYESRVQAIRERAMSTGEEP